MASALVPIASGFEEIEAVTVIDLLRRADCEVVVAGLDEDVVTGSHGITIHTDERLESALDRDYDMIVLPGGMPGASNLQSDERVLRRIKSMAKDGRFMAAICAAPMVLATAGVLDGKRATSFPGFLDPDSNPEISPCEDSVVQDGRIITSRGPGTAMDFALTLVENLQGTKTRDSVEARLQRPS